MAETPKQTSPVTVIGSDLLVIRGYSAAKGIGVGNYIASDVFTVGGYKWAIHFYPDGKSPEDDSAEDWVYMALAAVPAEGTHKVKFELTLIDQSGQGKHKVIACFGRRLPCTVTAMGGFKHRRAILEKSVYLRDDCFKIYCTVGVVAAAIDCSSLCSIQGPGIAREMVERPTPSCSMKETMSGSNLFVIQGYSMAKGIGAGKCVASNEFSVGGYKWAIYFYPDGKSPEYNSTYVSLYMALVSEGRDVQVRCELTLMDQSGKGKHRVCSVFPLTLKGRGSLCGYAKFYKRAVLETSDYLRDDCLKIYCTVGVVVSAIDYSRSCLIQVPDSDIGSHIGMLLENMEGCDITFNVTGEKFLAHKLILAARSPKLHLELLEGVDTEEVMVPDMEPKVFKVLLYFIYTDGLAENELIASAALVADTLTAKLLAAADRYDLERLKRLCESHLCKCITVNSVMQVLDLADRYKAAELKDVCLKFAAQNVTGGCDEDCSNGGGKSESVWDQLSDGGGGDNSGRRVRQRVEEEKEVSSGGGDNSCQRVRQRAGEEKEVSSS